VLRLSNSACSKTQRVWCRYARISRKENLWACVSPLFAPFQCGAELLGQGGWIGCPFFPRALCVSAQRCRSNVDDAHFQPTVNTLCEPCHKKNERKCQTSFHNIFSVAFIIPVWHSCVAFLCDTKVFLERKKYINDGEKKRFGVFEDM
jgi:hypothetical protein